MKIDPKCLSATRKLTFMFIAIICCLGQSQQLEASTHHRQISKKATIIQIMDPGRPGDVLLLIGDWPTNRNLSSSGVEIEVAQIINIQKESNNSATQRKVWQRIRPIQVSQQSLKFIIPEDWPMGIYACRVVPINGNRSFEPSDIVLLNAPDPWWLQGDKGARNASPGGWLRIFGKGLNFDKMTQIKLECLNKNRLVNVYKKEKGGYSLSVDLPKNLIAGTYEVSVNNGFGGKEVWKIAGHIQIETPLQWKKDIFDVTKYYKPSIEKSIDWTDAIKAALAAAKLNGGGVVYFPRGRYVINEELKIPAFIKLKGESVELVNLYWPSHEKAMNNLISGTDNFTVNDISIYTEGNQSNVITGRNNISVQRVRIRANPYYMKSASVIVGEVGSDPPGGAGISISGNNALITDCDIYHSASAIVMYHTIGGQIARNHLAYGNGPMQLYGVSRVIIEDNDCRSASLWASGIGISLYYSSCASYHIYFANNKINQTYGGDREAVTTDGHGTAYFGKSRLTNDTVMTLNESSWWGTTSKDMIKQSDLYLGIKYKKADLRSPFLNEEWHGLTMYIVNGKGMGQYRNLVACSGKIISIEKPWDVPPDSTSIVSIGKFQGRMLFINNEFYDAAKSVQLYAPNFECIIAQNQSWRTQSMNCSADFTSTADKMQNIRIEPSWYNQFLDNHFWEGNSWGNNSSTISIYTNDLSKNIHWPIIKNLTTSIGHIIRGNLLDNNTNINIQGNADDIVVERNKIQNVEQGILIRLPQNTNSDPKISNGILIRNNILLNVNK